MIRHVLVASLTALSFSYGFPPGIASAAAQPATVESIVIPMAAVKTYEVVASSLYVRTGPSTSDLKVDSLKRGTKFKGTKQSNGWISFENSKGQARYVSGSSEYVKVVSNGTAASSPKLTHRIVRDVNVRSGPSTTSTQLGVLSEGTRVSARVSSNGFMRTTYKGKTGYYFGTFDRPLSTSSSPKPAAAKVTHEIVREVNVRSGTSKTSKLLGSFRVGTKVAAKASSNGYMRTTYKGKTAYYFGTFDRALSGSSSFASSNVVVRHVRQDIERFPNVYSRKTSSSAYDVHYVPSGGMVKGVIEGSWFKLGPNLYTPMSNLSVFHALYSSGNGRAEPSLLCNMPSAASIYHILLSCSAVSGMSGLNSAFRARFGHDLKWGECYRTYDTQLSYKRWFGDRAATPGYSNHGQTSRQACDVNGSVATYGFDSTRGKWIEAYAGRYGFDRPSWADENGLKPEFWHYEFVG